MTWHIEFVAPTKEKAVDALMHPAAQQMRGLPIAVREQVINMIESMSELDPAAAVHIKTHGHLPGPSSAGTANMTIEVSLMPTYVCPQSL